MTKQKIILNCDKIIDAYKKGLLGQTIMPEDTNPGLKKMSLENKLSYFTLAMALNYQRNSYKLWESALLTYNDKNTRDIFDVKYVSSQGDEIIRKKLLKYKLALQKNNHINIWMKISKTVYDNFGSFESLMKYCNNDFLKLKDIIQKEYKKGFPYLSGVKIFNYWSSVLINYCGIKLKNANYIDIAPDTHITKCSVKLGVITQDEAEKLSKEEISKKWRKILNGSDLNPIDLHSPLWFWSRNGFIYKLK